MRVEQQNQVFSGRPIVNDAGAAALSPRPNGDASLAYPSTAPDESAEPWIGGDPGLKLTILLIA
jgi:hypothetical protein